MTQELGSPWVARFPELSRDQISAAITQYGPILKNLGKLHPREAGIRLQDGLGKVFVATDSIVSIIGDMYSTCRASRVRCFGLSRKGWIFRSGFCHRMASG